MSRTMRILVVIFGAVLIAAAVPTVVSAADKFTSVLIANTDAEPVPTRAIGTTSISGQVAVPDGVAVTNKPEVSVPDGVTIDGPLTVESAAPERYNRAVSAFHLEGGEACTALGVPEGKRLVVEVVHIQLNSGDLTNAYLRQVTQIGEGSLVFDRFRPAATTGPNGRIEGPFIDDELADLSICARAGASVRAVVVGVLENE